MDSPKYRQARRALLVADAGQAPYASPARYLRYLHRVMPLRDVVEKFAEVTGVQISHETARRWMQKEAG